jgi:hypothetical protein
LIDNRSKQPKVDQKTKKKVENSRKSIKNGQNWSKNGEKSVKKCQNTAKTWSKQPEIGQNKYNCSSQFNTNQYTIKI